MGWTHRNIRTLLNILRPSVYTVACTRRRTHLLPTAIRHPFKSSMHFATTQPETDCTPYDQSTKEWDGEVYLCKKSLLLSFWQHYTAVTQWKFATKDVLEPSLRDYSVSYSHHSCSNYFPPSDPSSPSRSQKHFPKNNVYCYNAYCYTCMFYH